jgi:hypothetical protein
MLYILIYNIVAYHYAKGTLDGIKHRQADVGDNKRCQMHNFCVWF